MFPLNNSLLNAASQSDDLLKSINSKASKNLASFTQITPDTRASSVVCWLNSSSTAVSSSLFVGYSSNIHFDKSHTESELLAYFTGLSWLCFLFFTEVHEINALLGGCSHLSVCPYIKAQPLLYT